MRVHWFLSYNSYFKKSKTFHLQQGYGQPGYGGPAPGGQQLEVGHGPYPSIAPSGGISPQVQQWFYAVDKDRSGFISAAELKSALVNAQGQTFSDTACYLMIGKRPPLHIK